MLKLLLLKHKLLAGIIISSFILGILFAFVNSDSYKLKTFLSFIDQMESLADQPNVFLSILGNNLKAAFVMQILGFLLIFPFLILFSNGYILGLFTDLVLRSDALSVSFRFLPVMVTSVMPHAIIELPTFILSGYTATLFGLKMFFTRKVEPKETRIQFYKKLLTIFFIIIVPLFIIAAGIEAYITPVLAGAVEQALFEKETAKDLLPQMLVQKADLNDVDSSGTEVPTRTMPKQLTWLVKLWGVFVYDASLHTRLLTTRPVRSGIVNIAFPDESFVWGTVAEFPSEAQAQIYEQSYGEALVKLDSLDDSVKVFLSGNNWTLHRKQKTFQGSSGSVGNYSYVFWYQGNNPRLLLAATERQAEKLIH